MSSAHASMRSAESRTSCASASSSWNTAAQHSVLTFGASREPFKKEPYSGVELLVRLMGELRPPVRIMLGQVAKV